MPRLIFIIAPGLGRITPTGAIIHISAEQLETLYCINTFRDRATYLITGRDEIDVTVEDRVYYFFSRLDGIYDSTFCP